MSTLTDIQAKVALSPEGKTRVPLWSGSTAKDHALKVKAVRSALQKVRKDGYYMIGGSYWKLVVKPGSAYLSRENKFAWWIANNPHISTGGARKAAPIDPDPLLIPSPP